MAKPFHDVGGESAGPIERIEQPIGFFEKRIDAMLMLLTDTRRRLIRVDEHRRTMEQFGPDLYWKLSYYERWLHSITSLMLEKGVITREELDSRMSEIRASMRSRGS
jgi:hypothetical protein